AGLMLVAHDSKAAGALSQLFSGRAVTKIYRATVTGLLKAEDLLVNATLDGKEAISRVTTLSQNPGTNTTEVKVSIETGRKHQIRRHLAGIGHPIVGDTLYGQPDTEGLQLEAVYLAFDCPLLKRRQAFGQTL